MGLVSKFTSNGRAIFYQLRVFVTENVLGILEKSLSWSEVLEPRSSVSSLKLSIGCALPLGIHVLFNLVQTGQALGAEEFHLFDYFTEKALLDQILDESLVILLCVKACKYFHRVDDLSLLLGPLPLKLLCPLQIEQPPLNDKLLPPDPLIQPRIVQIDDGVLELDLLLGVLLKEFHISQQQFCIHVVLLIEVASLRQVPDDLSACLDG